MGFTDGANTDIFQGRSNDTLCEAIMHQNRVSAESQCK